MSRSRAGRADDSLILTRPLQPELAFRRDKQPAMNFLEPAERFFDLGAPKQWTANAHGSCPVCERHVMTLVFYTKGQLNKLEPLDHPATWRKMERQLPVDCGCPLIAGSVTPHGKTSMMMRADVFTLLSMTNSAQMMSKGKWAEQIRRGCLLTLELEMVSKDVRKSIEKNKLFKNKFRGWHKVLHHKCTRNEVQDVRILNYPSALLSRDKLADEDADNIFVYATFLKPGPHHLVVFDPNT